MVTALKEMVLFYEQLGVLALTTILFRLEYSK
jgi:hypothetical protein